MRRTSHTCGGARSDGQPCENPVSRPGQRCHLHPKRRGSRKLKTAAKASWNATSHRAAPVSRVGHRLEQGVLRRILAGMLSFQWLSPKKRQQHGKWMAPVDAAAREIPHRRNSRGQGSTRPAVPHSSIYRRQLRREQ
jgi:hypothetical protein